MRDNERIPIYYRHTNVIIGEFKIFKKEHLELLKSNIIKSKMKNKVNGGEVRTIKDIEIYEISLLDDGTFGAGFRCLYE